VPGAPELDFVFTVCDQAAGEICPMWPGQPMTAHWGVPDPAAVEGDREKIRRAFFVAYDVLFRRIGLFTALRLENLERLACSGSSTRSARSSRKRRTTRRPERARRRGRSCAGFRRTRAALGPSGARRQLDPRQLRGTPAC